MAGGKSDGAESGLLSTNQPNGSESAVACQILDLARPLRGTLSKGDDR
jgi:hypothetical protein